MDILVIGGTGLISTSLVEHLLEKGHRVTAFTRGESENRLKPHKNLNLLAGDRREEHALKSLVENKTYDAAYDMISYHPKSSEQAAKVFRGKVGRFIHCSTISVYMVSNNVQCPITEDQDKGELMPYFERNPFGMDYGIKKRACEDVLWKLHDEKLFPVSMIRPTYIAGPHDFAMRDFFWIERILDGKPLLVPGSGDHAFQEVFVEDVAKAFASLLETEASIGQAYNAAAEEIFSLNDYIYKLGSLLDKKPELVHVDQEVFDSLPLSRNMNGDVFPFNVRRTSIFSLDKIKKDLNYHSTPFDEWMKKTISWFTSEFNGHSFGYEKREDEIQFIQEWKNYRNNLLREYV
ncbi:MAG: NAD-dependent epimerase/dehydratase family protein [Ignavibacteria bacterium]|jgi:nucleoside-diphosphate-sugar epimerase|nr:NAD-dependent epimerase/dehydratase family protein [Ignavibacteria bacterium]MCU7500055.1 NAD-dependent epimerase/dehydratase family protein [Ignavibacteria bacterium]MCU7512800.1 NAD-dependent epimerase/dehydratase family protein [Ignavibacteria bacterium]MCU7521789.1 NAD-dependent epimerase/dehydratase family protein [Ignavibacteria bacterium]MCU7524838.1 NAD-dependent epimerase/dehydratase family protein [Ignavibacteria bacterium]